MKDIKKFFYMHSLAKIQKDFPGFKDPDSCYTTNEVSIIGGWAPPMAEKINKISLILGDRSKDEGIVYLGGSIYDFDIRLGDILLVDPDKTENCYFIDKIDENYEITTCRSSNTIGGIINRPPPSRPKRKNRFKLLLTGRKEKKYGNMAPGNRT